MRFRAMWIPGCVRHAAARKGEDFLSEIPCRVNENLPEKCRETLYAHVKWASAHLLITENTYHGWPPEIESVSIMATPWEA